MSFLEKYRKYVASFLTLLMLTEWIFPLTSYALTSGPDQPEMKGFTAVGNSDMVDLFTGDFNYSIPLMDVGGNPLNLSYHSGAGMDDESSWVGYGWSLNPGVINRQLRGVPDDFKGVDSMVSNRSTLPNITRGANANIVVDFFGMPTFKIKGKAGKKVKLVPSINVGIQHDNYRGVNAQVGVNAGIQLGEIVNNGKTPNSQELLFKQDEGINGFSLGLNSSSMDGAGFNANINYSTSLDKVLKKESDFSGSFGFGMNSRAGLQNLTLTGTTTAKLDDKILNKDVRLSTGFSSVISFARPVYYPTNEFPMKNQTYSGSFNLGPAFLGGYVGIGISGTYAKQELATNRIARPVFGTLYSEYGKTNRNAQLDFNREKDIPYSSKVNYLPLPIPGNDMFSVQSQMGGGQYKIYHGSSGVFFDPSSKNTNIDFTAGGEIGATWQFGGNIHFQKINTRNNKWDAANQFLKNGDFVGSTGQSVSYEPAYFKRVGEPTFVDGDFSNKYKGSSAFAATFSGAKDFYGPVLGSSGRTKANGRFAITAPIKRETRDPRYSNLSYLTAAEASLHGYDRKIKSYTLDSLIIPGCINNAFINEFDRYESGTAGKKRTSKKAHHISEVTVLGEDGKRIVYGIPVYNKQQEEVSFSIKEDLTKRRRGIIAYNHNEQTGDNSPSNQHGRDHFYTKETTPAYATSYLMTAILSPDYVDKTGNGISEDDNGVGIRFNYTRITDSYKWRTPYDSANYNEGFISDNKDDKASYVYGEKEIWYMHSVESKTMLAQFILEDRDDGLGVAGASGGKNTGLKLKRLKEIRLYSKSDLIENKTDLRKAIPIKTVHFEYDYSTSSNLPNTSNGQGKLTLKKVYFTFGQNQKGRLNPYVFSYNTAAYPKNGFDMRQYDRWGQFKHADENYGGLNNSEFPYTLQNKSLTDSFASMWQMTKIKLPSGGVINISYESDDYAYVQDQRAGEMSFVAGIGTHGTNTGLISATDILIRLPQKLTSSGNKKELKFKYFSNIDYLYYKFFIDLDNKGHKEFVPGYAKIIDVNPVGDSLARITLDRLKDDRGAMVNPIAFGAWQMLRQSLPKYAYPGYDNLDNQDGNFTKSIKALGQALVNVKELITGFGILARSRNYSNKIDLQKSWVRLSNGNFQKLGGGSRVKQVEISDEWETISETPNAKTASYIQEYKYTTTTRDQDGKEITISSGVASYEPIFGGDENPFHQPVFYANKKALALNEYFYIEKPFGESFYPGPSVGYSMVSVVNKGSGEVVNKTGKTVSEFYTAKDFPTVTEILPIEKSTPNPLNILKILKVDIRTYVGLSQGYSVINYDMHGKLKSTTAFGQSGAVISKVEYFYKVKNDNAIKKELDNQVKVINPQGSISDAIMGEEVEMFTDQREQIMENLGVRIQASGGAAILVVFPIPFFFPGIGGNNEIRSYRASSTIKLVNRFGILEKVRKTENGSSITTENLLWDSETGGVLLTKTQNEFDDPVYSFNYPGHWAYPGMESAYKNSGTYLTGLSSGEDGVISNQAFTSGTTPLLFAGDEIIDLQDNSKYWVIYTNNAFRLIDQNGAFISLINRNCKILRSGRRNIPGTSIGSFASLENPIVNNAFQVNTLTKILDFKSMEYSEDWVMPSYCTNCPSGYTFNAQNGTCNITVTPSANQLFTVCGSENSAYTLYGSYLYTCTTPTNSSFERSRINLLNTFWNPVNGDQAISTYGGGCQSSLTLSNDNLNGDADYFVNHDTIAFGGVSSNVEDELGGSPPTLPGPLNRCGIWLCDQQFNVNNVWYTLNQSFSAPTTKNYYLGFAVDNEMKIYIDNVLINHLGQGPLYVENFRVWHILPITLSQGSHQLRIEVLNSGSAASFGVEIYNCTESQLVNATSEANLNMLFSTSYLKGQKVLVNPTVTCPEGATQVVGTGGETLCQVSIPASNVINPYYTGARGNWRSTNNFVYQTTRENLQGNPAINGATQIRKSGAYSTFTPFWIFNPTTGKYISNNNADLKWTFANTVRLTNTKGLEIENKDVLDRYTSALYGYLQSVPVAVTNNAKFREMQYDGFEDYSYELNCAPSEACTYSRNRLNMVSKLNGDSIKIDHSVAHSGKSSLRLNATSITISQPYGSIGDDNHIGSLINASGQYTIGPSNPAKGFMPDINKTYILSLWVKDNNQSSSGTNLTIHIGNEPILFNSTKKWPMVEGWKRIEVPLVFPIGSTTFSLTISSISAGEVFIDDLRLHPYDAQMKSFAYDPTSMRLMAEMDENNFATFYEYDEEGTLIRVKKETERGIMTIKETRSSLRRK